MRYFYLYLAITSMLPAQLAGQIYMEKKTQHRFAQTYVGINTQITPASGKLVYQGEEQPFPSVVSPRFTIGGLHFWGKWDFNVNFPLGYFSDNRIGETGEVIFKPGADLSARYYLWRVEYNKLRPYFGVSSNVMGLEISHGDDISRLDQFVTTSLIGGISYASNEWQVNAEVMWMPSNDRTFYSTQIDKNTFELPPTYFSIGISKFFDVTLHSEKEIESGANAAIEKKLGKDKKLNSLSISAAPSAAFFLQAPSFESSPRASLPRHKVNFNWDLGIGYLIHDAKTHIGFSYRSYSSAVESYDLEYIIRRQSFALEAFYFFWNFNGFVPYVGPSISYERWATGEFVGDTQVGDTKRTNMVSPGIIFGWDILASELETWVLRTNLRYYPFQQINNLNERKVRVDQFEFNFIQVVLYPGRMSRISKARKNY